MSNTYTKEEAWVMVIYFLILGGAMLGYGFLYLFVPKHNLAPMCLTMGLFIFSLGCIGLLAMPNYYKNDKETGEEEANEPS